VVTPPGGAGLVVAIVSPAKDAERWRRRRQRKHVHIAVIVVVVIITALGFFRSFPPAMSWPLRNRKWQL